MCFPVDDKWSVNTQVSPFGRKLIQDLSSKELRLLTPTKTYTKLPLNVSACDITENYFNSPLQSLSPGTKSYVSQLCLFPSPNNYKTSNEYKANQYDRLLEKYKKQKNYYLEKERKFVS